MKKLIALLYIVSISLPVAAQFAPQAGVTGSTAIERDDNNIVGWANACVVERGWVDIADKVQGAVTAGTDANAIGKSNNHIVSLGDSGIAILTFESPIYNGDGADFVVFENGFVNPNMQEEAFLELAFVEVSSDDVNYVRFPASSLTDTPQVPGAGVYMNARKINNLAGKYRGGYGVPFDLEELKAETDIDVNNITHVRIVDVVGDIQLHTSLDKDGNTINDPYPTPFPSGGFDLDAVGVLHMKGKWPANVIDNARAKTINIYPNPAQEYLHFSAKGVQAIKAQIIDVTGRTVLSASTISQTIDVRSLVAGIYYLTITDENGEKWVERFNKY